MPERGVDVCWRSLVLLLLLLPLLLLLLLLLLRSAEQERSRLMMDELAEELLPVEHGALGAQDAGGRGGARVSVDMPLHLIPPFVPVDLPSRKVSVTLCSYVCVHARAGRA